MVDINIINIIKKVIIDGTKTIKHSRMEKESIKGVNEIKNRRS